MPKLTDEHLNLLHAVAADEAHASPLVAEALNAALARLAELEAIVAKLPQPSESTP